MRELRPLGVGELLDRAVTLYVANFRQLVAVVAAGYIPYGLAEWAVLGPIFARMQHAQPAKPGTPVNPMAILGPDAGLRFFVGFVAGIVLLALMRTAILSFLDGAYAGERRSLREVFARGFARLGSQVLLMVLASLLAAVVWLVGVFILSILATVVVIATGGGRGGLSAAGAVVAIMLFAALLVPIAWIYIAYQLATVEVTRGAGAPSALGYGLNVAFGRSRGRALLAALVIGAVTLGYQIGAAIVGGLIGTVISVPAFNFALGTVLGILIEGLISAFVLVYAIDVKVRREGLDLALEAGIDASQPA